jgi:hypothetical protein
VSRIDLAKRKTMHKKLCCFFSKPKEDEVTFVKVEKPKTEYDAQEERIRLLTEESTKKLEESRSKYERK